MSLWLPTGGACVAPDLNWSVMVKAGTRRDVGLKSPQWGLKSRSRLRHLDGPQGTHGCSTQEVARFCECQRVNRVCYASLTSVSYDQLYGRSISNSLVKFHVRLAAQLALNSFSSSCHGNSNCGFCRVSLILTTEIFGTCVCIFPRVICSFCLPLKIITNEIILGISCTERKKQRMAWHLSVSSHQLLLLVKRHVGDLVPSTQLLLRH